MVARGDGRRAAPPREGIGSMNSITRPARLRWRLLAALALALCATSAQPTDYDVTPLPEVSAQPLMHEPYIRSVQAGVNDVGHFWLYMWGSYAWDGAALRPLDLWNEYATNA